MSEGQTPPPASAPLDYQSPLSPGFNWNDFLAFRTMITVPIIKILFLVIAGLTILGGLLGVLGGLITLFSNFRAGVTMIFVGLIWMILGPILTRIYCEILIVIFRINETLTEIRQELRQGRPA